MSTHFNIMITFSNLETFADRRKEVPDCDTDWTFKTKLHDFQNAEHVWLFVDHIISASGIIYVIGTSKNCPDNEFIAKLLGVNWVEPEAIQVQWQDGDKDMDKWHMLKIANLVEK